MKKILSFLIALTMIFASTGTPSIASNNDVIRAGRSIDIIDAFENPEKYENIEIGGPFTHEEILVILQEEENMTLQEAKKTAPEPIQKSSTGYLTFRETVRYNSAVAVQPRFYCEMRFGGTSPTAFVSVRNASLKLDAGSIVKQFDGDLYYNLETSTRLYYDLNGSLYNNGSVRITGGGSIRVGGSGKLNLNLSYATNYYGYIQKSSRFRI